MKKLLWCVTTFFVLAAALAIQGQEPAHLVMISIDATAAETEDTRELASDIGDEQTDKGVAVPEGNAPWQKFYALDPAALFFKRFSLVTTIIVLIISVEYLAVVNRFVAAAHPGAGVGEFLVLPLFTCAGLMWMASAVDFVMIFVSLELVTISFYVLVTYTRRRADSKPGWKS